jgi:hypothetical protein
MEMIQRRAYGFRNFNNYRLRVIVLALPQRRGQRRFLTARVAIGIKRRSPCPRGR